MACQNPVSSLKLFKNGLSGVVFDCDGVMIDSREANRGFYNRILDAFGLEHMTAEQEEFAFRSTAMDALQRMIPAKDHGRIEKTIAEVIDYNRDVMPQMRLMPGFLEFIRMLHASGLHLGISTNRIRDGLQRVLDFFSLPPYFNPTMTASDVAPKPSPEGLLRILEIWDLAPGQLLFVGDSVDDMAAACAAGVPFCAFRSHDINDAAIRQLRDEFPSMPCFFAVNGYDELKTALAPVIGTGPLAGNSTSGGEA